jgi:hypothetical protein
LTLGCKIVAGSWKERTPCCTFPQKLWSIAQISNKLQHNYHQSHYFMAHLIILFLVMPGEFTSEEFGLLKNLPWWLIFEWTSLVVDGAVLSLKTVTGCNQIRKELAVTKSKKILTED